MKLNALYIQIRICAALMIGFTLIEVSGGTESPGDMVETRKTSVFLTKTKSSLVEKLQESKVLDSNRADIINKSSIYFDKSVKSSLVRMKETGVVEFVVKEGLMNDLEKQLKDRHKDKFEDSMTAEAFLMEITGLVSRADLLLAVGSQEKVDKLPVELKEGLSFALQADVAKLFLSKNLSMEEMAKALGGDKVADYAAYMTSGDGLEFLEDPFSNHLYIPRYAGIEEMMQDSNANDNNTKKETGLSGEPPANVAVKEPVAKIPTDPLEPLYEQMKKASTREEFMAVLKTISEMEDIRKFYLTNINLPVEIPFEKLSASEASVSTTWFSKSSAEAQLDKEYLEYYCNKFTPEYKSFFEKLATKTVVRKYKATVKTKKSDDHVLYYAEIDRNFESLIDRNYYNVLILTPLNISSIISPKQGAEFMVEAQVFYLPPAYGASVQQRNHLQFTTYLYCLNSVGNFVDKGQKNISVNNFQGAHSDGLTLRGWGLSANGTRIYLNSFVDYTEFAQPVNSSEDKKMSSFEISILPPDVRFPVAKEKPKVSTVPVNNPNLSSRNPDLASPEGVFYGGLLVIFVIPWLALPFMIYILIMESRRKFKEIPLPEGFSPEEGDFENVNDEYKKILEFIDSLETREIEGEDVPVYTHRREINKGYALLKEASKWENKTPETIFLINDFGKALNEAQKRYMNGSKWLLALVILAFGGMGSMMFMAGNIMASQLWFCIPFIYYMALKTPTYKLANPEPGYYRVLQAILQGLGVGSLFAAADAASTTYTTIYKDQYGNRYAERDHSTGCFVALIFIVIVITFAPFLLLLNCTVNFLRNYVTSK